MDSCAENKTSLNQKGSSVQDGPEFICIGKIHRSHGIHGDVVFNPMTDFPERIRRGKVVYAGEDHLPLKISTVRAKPPYLLLAFEELSDETQAAAYRNQFVYVKASELPPLPEGEYYFHQLIGLTAVDQQGKILGFVKDILETGSKDVYVVQKVDGGEELIPDVPEYILKINIPDKSIVVRLPEWM